MKITATVYTIQEITSITNSNYQELLDTVVWQVPDSDTAFTSTGSCNNNNNNGNNNKNRRRGCRQNNNNDNFNNGRRDPNHPKYTPPKPGKPQKRKRKGITLYWCAKCKAWRCHNTNQHKDPEEYNKIRNNNDNSSASTAVTGSTKPPSDALTLTDKKIPLSLLQAPFNVGILDYLAILGATPWIQAI